MTEEIKLKIISGGKIILAECVGYEAELFAPIILNNRIVLENAVVSRQCCDKYIKTAKKHLENINTTKSKHLNSLLMSRVQLGNRTHNQKNIVRKSDPDFIPILPDPPRTSILAELIIEPWNTPEKANKPTKKNRVVPAASFNMTQSCKENYSPIQRLPTPDIVRRAVVQNANESVVIPGYTPAEGLKIVRLHRVNTPNTPKNPVKMIMSKAHVHSSLSSPRILRNLSNVSSFCTPPSLQQTYANNSLICQTPNQPSFLRNNRTPPSGTKWRKCITPQRTYLRRINGKKTPLKTNVQPLHFGKNGQLQNYPSNSTMAPKCKNQFVFKRRKLIVDSELMITPRKFKSQLFNTEDLNRSKYQLPKIRRHYYLSHMTAFDLLTNSSFYPHIGKKVNAIFRQGCVNKRSGTILKYKQLIKDIPAP